VDASSVSVGCFESNCEWRADITLRTGRAGRANTTLSKAWDSGSGSVSVQHERSRSSRMLSVSGRESSSELVHTSSNSMDEESLAHEPRYNITN
jgi:hypothetical protein